MEVIPVYEVVELIEEIELLKLLILEIDINRPPKNAYKNCDTVYHAKTSFCL